MANKLHCAEFVFPGHPDKLSDAIADAGQMSIQRLQPVTVLREWVQIFSLYST